MFHHIHENINRVLLFTFLKCPSQGTLFANAGVVGPPGHHHNCRSFFSAYGHTQPVIKTITIDFK